MKDLDAAVELTGLSPEEAAASVSIRAEVHLKNHEREAAIADFSRAVETHGISGPVRARALYRRGMAKGATESAIADLTESLRAELPMGRGWRAFPLTARGMANAGLTKYTEAIADFTAAFDVADAPAAQRAAALFNRAAAYRQKGDLARASADLESVSTFPGSPAELKKRANALREALLGKKEPAQA